MQLPDQHTAFLTQCRSLSGWETRWFDTLIGHLERLNENYRTDGVASYSVAHGLDRLKALGFMDKYNTVASDKYSHSLWLVIPSSRAVA